MALTFGEVQINHRDPIIGCISTVSEQPLGVGIIQDSPNKVNGCCVSLHKVPGLRMLYKDAGVRVFRPPERVPAKVSILKMKKVSHPCLHVSGISGPPISYVIITTCPGVSGGGDLMPDPLH